jgi:hypothetical protein
MTTTILVKLLKDLHEAVNTICLEGGVRCIALTEALFADWTEPTLALSPAAEETMDRTEPRVFVVAAEPALRFSLAEVLHSSGFDVIALASHAEALTLLAHDPVEQEPIVLVAKELGAADPSQAEGRAEEAYYYSWSCLENN